MFCNSYLRVFSEKNPSKSANYPHLPKETAPHFCGGWCSRYLFSRLGQSIVLPWCSAQRIIIIMIAGGQSYHNSASVRWTLAGRKKPRSFDRGLCSQCLVSRLGQLSFAVKKHAGGMFQAKKKPPDFSGGLCSRYLFSRLGQAIVLA